MIFFNQHHLITLLLTIILAYLFVFVLKKVVHSLLKGMDFLDEKRRVTIEVFVKNTSQFVAIAASGIFALSPYIDFSKFLAGTALVTVILGFGAQSIIKDIYNGLCFYFEGQLRKGDLVTINQKYTGTVEDPGLRVLKLREYSGKLLFISNSKVEEVLNASMEHRRIIEKIVVSFRENPKRVFDVLKISCDELNERFSQALKKDMNREIIENFHVQGLSSLNANFYGYEYTVVALVKEEEYDAVNDEARKIIAQNLFEQQIIMAEQSAYYTVSDKIQTTKEGGEMNK